MCDERLWRGEKGAIANALGARAPVRDADFSQDDSIAALAERTLAATAGSLFAVGFSMGAIVALEMWLQAPERIAGLVLLGYNASADLPERAAHRPRQQAEARGGGLARLLAEELKPNYLAAAHRGDTALLDLLLDMGMRLGPEVFARQSEALRTRADRRAVLHDINRSLYCGSKWALEGLNKAFALDLAAHGIRSNTIAPTFIETPLTKPFFEDEAFKASVLAKIKLGRIGQVEDLMGAILFLASDASALVTGTSLIVDGGWTAD